MNAFVPDFSFESELWKCGVRFVGGADEVGRGSLAGPVVAACVVYRHDVTNLPLINDSKRLTHTQRLTSNEWIKKHAVAYGIGMGSVSEINRLGISHATRKAFRRSVISCNKVLKVLGHGQIGHLLVDAFFVPNLAGIPLTKRGVGAHKSCSLARQRGLQTAIIKGDQRSISIASASIVAKVFRDRLMCELGSNSHHKKFGWINNKGYGTKKHIDALCCYGPSKHHRKKYVQTALSKSR